LKYARDVSETPYILEYEPLTETIRERAEKPPFDGQTEYAKYKYAVYYPPTESIYVFRDAIRDIGLTKQVISSITQSVVAGHKKP
jgi:hypothetical protein